LGLYDQFLPLEFYLNVIRIAEYKVIFPRDSYSLAISVAREDLYRHLLGNTDGENF